MPMKSNKKGCKHRKIAGDDGADGKPFGMMNSKSIPGLQVLGEILILAGFFRFWRKKLDKLTIYSYNMANLR